MFIAVGDGSITIPKFNVLVGHPEFNEDPRFATYAARCENEDEMVRYYREAFLSQPAEFWLKRAEELDVTLVRMAHFSDVSEDPQAWANGFVESVDFPNGNTDTMPSSPIEMSGASVPPTCHTPATGTDTVTTLRTLGFDDAQIRTMLESGAAVGQYPEEN